MKNRQREAYSFANINLLGRCNVNCYFCLGKDIEELLSKQNQVQTHFSQWKNFEQFLVYCWQQNIQKLYVTGQNTDSLLYKYLDELIDYLHDSKFTVGLRTNGYLAPFKMREINKCENSVGYSIHSLDPETNYKIMGRRDIPDWDKIIPHTRNCRVQIVVNRYNINQIDDLLRFIAKYPNVKYIQVRRISTDTRYELLKEDIDLYERFFEEVQKKYKQVGTFYHAQQFEIYGKQVNSWRTVETSVNSMNYFTDGTISDNYFVVEGYLKNYQKS